MDCLQNHSTKSYFSRLQIMSKKLFTSMYFLQILSRPWRTPLIKEHLSLMPPDFLTPERKRTIFWKN